ncbi:MAG TPA: transglycosylase SLT domain-containing protein [Methylococcaceae bacterium]|nr:transglycosylase SLT domain-containing protein [Methylococcaceae bacterium]
MAREAAAKQPGKRTDKPKKKRTPPQQPAATAAVRVSPPTSSRRRRAIILGTEVAALLTAGLIATIAVLGRSGNWFAGTGFWSNLLPFAGTVLALALVTAVFLRLWLPIRCRLMNRAAVLPASLAMLIAAGAGWYAAQDEFDRELGNLRTLVGGTEEAERSTLAHQVFASYRRCDLTQMQRIIERARVYESTIQEAAEVYGIDAEVLVGVGAAESSFYPRDSKDGGRGLFQITAPPKVAVELVKKRLALNELDLLNQRHNTLIAAATLHQYLTEMRGDLFLGLLAYNIGPKNGGLRSIMQQYGARDFVTIQPYLQNLPRDYPIRVLTAALAYRLWRLEGKLPRYEEGSNAMHIQSIGIPGLQVELTTVPSSRSHEGADQAA